jgi:hypothetical protein
VKRLLPILPVLLAAALMAQQQPPARPQASRTLTVEKDASGEYSIDPRSFIQVMLPSDAPLEVVKLDYGLSTVTRRQNSLQMELNLAVTVRNRSDKPVEGVAIALGGLPSGSMGLSAMSGIHVESGAVFTLPAHMSAHYDWSPQPNSIVLEAPSSMQLRLDAVLFSDGTGYGPDVMRALSTMRINQAESLRDHRFFQALYQSRGLGQVLDVLQNWANQAAGMSGESSTRVLTGQEAERARALAQAADFRATRLAGAPLEIVSARARIYSGRLVDPAIEVRNISGKPITDLVVTWLVRDGAGKEFRAATLSESGRPQSGYRFELSSGEKVALNYPAVLDTGSGAILAGRVFLRAVQFSDGRVWIADRPALDAAGLPPGMTVSPEVIRLFRLYQSRGAPGLLAELRR